MDLYPLRHDAVLDLRRNVKIIMNPEFIDKDFLRLNLIKPSYQLVISVVLEAYR